MAVNPQDPRNIRRNLAAEIAKDAGELVELGTALRFQHGLPGIFLLLGMGAANLFAAALLLLRPQWGWAERLNPFNSQEWPWTLAMAMGVFVMVWIAVQVVSVTLYSFLQPAVFLAG